MRELIVNMEEILTNSVLVLTMLMEVFGVCVLVYTAVKCFIKWLRKADNMRLELAEGIALALEFKMGGEVLRTVAVREWAELGILGAVIALRGLLTFLIHWEIKNEQKAMEKQKS
ncbi:MAG: DUF1622 domain-containing protein [Lachnospiraceae bacterium]|nr:DUF1622 domain-containing protein [Lachnospiraceae bacterium]